MVWTLKIGLGIICTQLFYFIFVFIHQCSNPYFSTMYLNDWKMIRFIGCSVWISKMGTYMIKPFFSRFVLDLMLISILFKNFSIHKSVLGLRQICLRLRIYSDKSSLFQIKFSFWYTCQICKIPIYIFFIVFAHLNRL